MKKSLVLELIDYGRSVYPNTISTTDIERFGLSLGYSAYNAKRRMQELTAKGIFQRDMTEKKYGKYQYQPPQPKTEEQKEQERIQLLNQALL